MTITRKALNWYARLSPRHGKVLPPYEHVVQIGDPTLRRICEPVMMEKIKSKEIHTLILKLHHVINKYGSVGMSAPQIGVNLRVFAMKHTKKQISKVFINPHMKIVNYQKVVHSEGCESIRGLSADVPRYKEVEITALNEEGEKISRVFKDWPSRIVQHELDHLNGQLYTDIMDRKTLTCTCWEEVNMAQGKLTLPF